MNINLPGHLVDLGLVLVLDLAHLRPTAPSDITTVTNFKQGDFLKFFYYVLYSTLLYLPPLRFNCVGGCWDRTQDY
jgi:hypothetical protein